MRVAAYTKMQELQKKGLSKKEIITEVTSIFNLGYGTVYDWITYNHSQFGKRKITFVKELFYVLGALLGDGCAYYWKKGRKYGVILVGDELFIRKFTDKLYKCIPRRITGSIIRSKNCWQAKTWNIELYSLFKKIRQDKKFLLDMAKSGSFKENGKEFVEGLFDAEGCVKIIKEKVRITPKICLDITNTDKEILDLAKLFLKEAVNIESHYSIQKANPLTNRLTAYHLRIYKKEYVKTFFESLKTTKLKPEKNNYLQNWLNYKKREKISLPLLSDSSSQLASN